MARIFMILGALSALLAVAAGAFGAHSLKSQLSVEWLSIFEVGVRYHMYHAFALIAVAWAQAQWPSRVMVTAGILFVLGTVIFSGSLYLLSLTGQRWMGAITPLGGLAFLAGWGCLAWGAWKSRAIE